MKKETYFLKNQVDSNLIEVPAPLIIWSLHLNGEVLYMPEFYLLVETTYFPN
jgi:hypothetical protein